VQNNSRSGDTNMLNKERDAQAICRPSRRK
jgi:hypothetical protein